MMGNKTKQVVLTVFSAGALLLEVPLRVRPYLLTECPFRSNMDQLYNMP